MNRRPPAPKAGALPLRYTPPNYVDAFIKHQKATKGLTVRGEEWLQETLSKFQKWLQVPISKVTTDNVTSFLSLYEDKPFRKHSFYRSLHTLFKWLSRMYDTPNPFLDRWGNRVIDAPKLPHKILSTRTPQEVAKLISACEKLRDKAIVSLLMDSGARRSEMVAMRVEDVDVECRRIRTLGKGNREGWLMFGVTTGNRLERYINAERPEGSLFGLTASGLRAVLVRLERRTGIKANPHSFRRGFATELRRQGLSELDIMELGRWSDSHMVKRYTAAYNFDDAAKRYKQIVE